MGAVVEEDEEGVSDGMVKYQDHWEMKSARRVHHSAGYKSLYVNLNASSSCPFEKWVLPVRRPGTEVSTDNTVSQYELNIWEHNIIEECDFLFTVVTIHSSH